MKLIVALALALAFAGIAHAIAVPLNEDHVSFKCKACKWLDRALLDVEDVTGVVLDTYLDKKCNEIPLLSHFGIIRNECKKLINEVVDKVENLGHKLDQNELCEKLIHAC